MKIQFMRMKGHDVQDIETIDSIQHLPRVGEHVCGLFDDITHNLQVNAVVHSVKDETIVIYLQ